jgi:hypothetical protein
MTTNTASFKLVISGINANNEDAFHAILGCFGLSGYVNSEDDCTAVTKELACSGVDVISLSIELAKQGMTATNKVTFSE